MDQRSKHNPLLVGGVRLLPGQCPWPRPVVWRALPKLLHPRPSASLQADFADVYVCAPSGERSAQSHAITLGRYLSCVPTEPTSEQQAARGARGRRERERKAAGWNPGLCMLWVARQPAAGF